MRRVTSSVIVFFMFFSAAANLLESTGTTDAMGVQTGVSAGAKLNEAAAAMSQVRGSAGTVESLFSIYTMVTSSMEAFAVGMSAGPRLLSAAGVPSYIIVFLFAPAAVIVGLDILYALSGRDL